jgi:WD40 repeat protein
MVQVMEPIRRIEFEHDTGIMRFSQDGSRLLAISQDKIVSYNADGTAEGAAIAPLVVFDADYVNEEQIVVAGMSIERQYGIAVYALRSQSVISEVSTGYVRSVCVDHQRGCIFAGKLDEPNIIHVYDLALNPLSEFETPDLHMPLRMALSHSGDKLAVAGVAFGLWDVSGEARLISEECPREIDCTGTPCEVNSCDITPGGHYAVAGLHGAKGVCVVLDGESGNVIKWIGPEWDFLTSPDTVDVAISPDGKYVAVAESPGKTVKVYRVSDGTVSRQYNVASCYFVAFLPTNDLLVLGSGNSISFWSFQE